VYLTDEVDVVESWLTESIEPDNAHGRLTRSQRRGLRVNCHKLTTTHTHTHTHTHRDTHRDSDKSRILGGGGTVNHGELIEVWGVAPVKLSELN